MSTYRSILAISSLCIALSAGAVSHIRQGGATPVKLTGPSTVSVSEPIPEVAGKRMIEHYTVTMNQTSAFDQQLSVSDSAHILQHPTSVTVPAGSLTANFTVTPIYTGTTTLTVSNANGYASEDLTVIP